MKRKILLAFVIFVFLLGFCLFMYPTVSNLWNEHLNNRVIDEYEEAVEQVSDTKKAELLEQAHLYNKYIHSSEKLEELGLNYDDILNVYGNGVMGYIEIPRISGEIVIYHHTEETELQRGVGHLDTTSLPVGGEGTHCALAGHRGLPNAKLFTNLDQMKIDDVFYIHVLGETLKYRVDDISVVEPEEVSKLKIYADEDYVTLVTCTPYGINSHRLLVRGTRVYEDDDSYEILHTPNELSDINPVYIVPLAMIALVMLAFAAVRIKKAAASRRAEENNREDNEEDINKEDDNRR